MAATTVPRDSRKQKCDALRPTKKPRVVVQDSADVEVSRGIILCMEKGEAELVTKAQDVIRATSCTLCSGVIHEMNVNQTSSWKLGG